MSDELIDAVNAAYSGGEFQHAEGGRGDDLRTAS